MREQVRFVADENGMLLLALVEPHDGVGNLPHPATISHASLSFAVSLRAISPPLTAEYRLGAPCPIAHPTTPIFVWNHTPIRAALLCALSFVLFSVYDL